MRQAAVFCIVTVAGAPRHGEPTLSQEWPRLLHLAAITVLAPLCCSAATAPPPEQPAPNVWVRIDKMYTSEHGNDVVLLKGVPHKISGTAYGPTDAVDVWLDGKLVARTPVTGTKGNMTDWPVWQAMLPPMPAGFGHTVNVTSATHNATSRSSYNASTGIHFGTVLLCSGQSNMVLSVGPGHFDADNGTAESLASSAFTGKISLLSSYRGWQNVSNTTLPAFSAVCWYTGKAYYNTHMADGTEPLALMLGAASGTPIEYWVRDEGDVAGCGNITGTCWNATRVRDHFGRWTGMSHLYNNYIKPWAAAGLGVSAIIWDQAEADVGCHVDQCPTPFLGGDPAYACLQKAMIAGWRADFAPVSGQDPKRVHAAIPWVGVQLPGYGGPIVTGVQTSHLFEMRLGQAAGVAGVEAAEVVPTYDLSCPQCPWGSIHPTDKQAVGARVASRLGALVLQAPAGAGPAAVSATATPPPTFGSSSVTTVSIVFQKQGGGATPIQLRLLPTRNCTLCCKAGSDLDVSIDGGNKWVAGNGPAVAGLGADGDTIKFEVTLGAAWEGPMLVRYTATQVYPQCAISDITKLPAYPFQLDVAVQLP